MNVRRTLLAAMAAAALVVAALPAIAAAQPSMHTEEPHFTVSGGHVLFTAAGVAITCKSTTGTGEYEGKSPYTTGKIHLTFHECEHVTSGFKCTTPGRPMGEITTTELKFHLVTATDVTGGEPVDGILITTNEGHFATFNCFLLNVVISGNGVIGEFTEETFTQANEFEFTFEQHQEEDTQTYETICKDETDYDLTASVNGGALETAVLITEIATSFTEGFEGTLT